METKKSDKVAFVLILVTAIIVMIICAICQPKDGQKYVSTKPTAGICRYLGVLQSDALKHAEPDLIEAAVTPVAASNYIPEEPEKEEEVMEDAEERTREECLTKYFGYVPTDDEIALWTQLVMDECGHTEPDNGVRAVADVIANRCRDDRFPDTITGVVYQRGQFQPVGDATLGRFEVSERVRDICSECICGGIRYPYLFFTAGYYNPYCIPGEVIGHHYFGY